MAANIYAKLQAIQSELFVPKGKKNEFGGFNYRSCEDILKVLKPLVAKHGCALTMSNSMVPVGDRTYVEVTATLADVSGDGTITVTAQAREPQMKKGMDDMQVTGATSSYARKYALAGLFCIDNEKDADDMDNRGEGAAKSPAIVKKPVVVSAGKKAWNLFQTSHSKLGEDEQKTAFAQFIRASLGMKQDAPVSSKDLTEAQWLDVLVALKEVDNG